MKFIAQDGKQVCYKTRILTAADGGFETNDPDLIETLKKAKDVEIAEPVPNVTPTSLKHGKADRK